ncbi:SNF2 family N-terminal domain-containing protein [Pyronema omphalodes]|nr:SNF2 family N-terminal domain-containing protein [Pyronema omphalodes]
MLGYKSGSDDEDNSVIVLDTSTGRRTVTAPAKATRKTSRPRAKRKAPEATRKSGRKRHKKTYVEPGLEDEFETVEIKKSTQPRVIHSKETFQVLDDTSDFVKIHNTQCATCGVKGHSNDRGQLICCQGCTATYHKLCLGHRAGREHLCKRCIGRQKMKDPLTASLDRCTECHEQGNSCAPFKNPFEKKKPIGKALDARAATPYTEVSGNLINNAENILFRCVGCHRAWHYDHLVARGPKASKKDKVTDIRMQRIMQYKFDHKCTDCLKYEGKIVIVAWRPADKEHHNSGESFELTDFPEDEREYLVKQEDESYFHVEWMPGPWVAGAYTHRKTGFSKGKPASIVDDYEAIPESYLRIDIVFDVEFKVKVTLGNDFEADLARINDVESAYTKFIGLDYNEVFWDTPPEESEEERYQDWKRAYEDYIRGFYVKPATRISQKIAQTRKTNFKKLEIKEQPEYIKHGTLMKYQLNGLNWLYYKWHQGHNGILADEMGLGKTVQIVAFLSVLCEEQKIWPFLIIVPQATVPNWRREIQNWAPNIRVVVYAGTDVAKTIVRDYEMFHDNGDLKCHVVVTSYDTALSDAAVLRKIPWQGLVVDEGQRLKNAQSLLYQELSQWKFNHKVLLSGTPLQNNFRELFNLLHFIDPQEINAKELEEEYGDGNLTNENAPKMLELIKPYFLRRTKAEVLTHLPPMAEVIVPVSMSALQRKLYKSILSKDTSLIRAILSRDKKSKQIEAAKLANLLMQLRKCVSHPFIYNKEIEENTTDDPEIIHRNLVEASSKLGLLNIMLPKLKERGHRVLIFSQFLDMLDVMEDFLRGHDLKYHRLDGKLKAMDKQKGIDEFNSADTETFAFLLSTRAGGVGINLATADTVIILDPDYNPFQDIQAISRAHRIGQKDKVLVFKIVTRDTVEEKIVQIGKKKLSLAHIITDKMNNSSDDNGPTVSDIESILSYGAKKLFEDDEDESVIKYDDKSIDKLLDRSHIEATKPTDGDGEIAGEQPFSFARVWANDKGELEEEDADDFEKAEEEAPPGFWERVLEEREEEARREAEAQREELGRGRRKRNMSLNQDWMDCL